ncbi:MAG TPA: hypothetical protein IAC40_04450 [Candidatus Faecivivens stercorigallinarum]|nr:hypothetical protein [Candidatus Faecivivens stercorigallinarum]
MTIPFLRRAVFHPARCVLLSFSSSYHSTGAKPVGLPVQVPGESGGKGRFSERSWEGKQGWEDF